MIIEIMHEGRKCAMIRHADDTITSDQLAELMQQGTGNHWNWNLCNQQSAPSHAVAV